MNKDDILKRLPELNNIIADVTKEDSVVCVVLVADVIDTDQSMQLSMTACSVGMAYPMAMMLADFIENDKNLEALILNRFANKVANMAMGKSLPAIMAFAAKAARIHTTTDEDDMPVPSTTSTNAKQ